MPQPDDLTQDPALDSLEQTEEPQGRSYGCSFGCGNPYDYIVISCADGSTEFLCLPDYVRLAMDMVAAVTEPDNPMVQAAVLGAGQIEQVPHTHHKPKARGKNAPVTMPDDDTIEEFDGVITVDELPDEFR